MSKGFFLAVLLVLPLAFQSSPSPGAETILVDFSGKHPAASARPSGSWNVISSGAEGHRQALLDSSGHPTAVTLEVADDFLEGIGSYHDNAWSDKALPWVDEEVLKGLFWLSSSNPKGRITLSGLDNNSSYALEVVASRNKAGAPLTADYCVQGRFTENSRFFHAHDNGHVKHDAMVWKDVTPTAGKIVLDVALTGDFGYLNAMRLRKGGPATKVVTLVEKALRAMDGADEIVFVVRGLYEDGHYYANFGHWSSDPNKMMYAAGGSKLCKLNLRTGQISVLLEDPQGGIRDPRVDYDGAKILFSYRKGGTKYSHLYEIHPDGGGLRQLTSGDWDDVEPDYLPGGGIVFVSSRGNCFVPCYHTQTGRLYNMDASGNIRPLSANNVGDHRPAVLPSGRVLYTRWDYVDRAPQKFHSLWTMNPDGSDQMLLFGNTVSPEDKFFVMIDALPIPGSDHVVAVFSPGHGFRENAGHVKILNPPAGPDDWSSLRQISPSRRLGDMGMARGRDGFRDPYPLSEDCFLVAEDKSLLVLDGHGTLEEVYRADEMIHDPRVIRPRLRERVIPPRTDLQKSTGQLVLANVYHGRNMAGVQPGEIKSLLVLEDLPKPVSYYSLPGAISMDGTHTLHRILGTVPVEPDGSASFKVPALRALFFVALDEQGLAVKRMQSYTTVMPGETQSCVGCHEPRTGTAAAAASGTLMALNRPASEIEPVPGVPEVVDYPRDIQPVWDKHCVSCHGVETPSGRVVLTGDCNEWFTQSYYALFAYNQISDARRYDEDGNHPPRGFGTAASPLMKKIDGEHYGAKLAPRERDLVRLWVEAGATFAGTYAAYNHQSSAVAGAFSDTAQAEIGKPLGPIVERRCLACHGSAAGLGQRVDKVRVNPLYTTSPANPWRGRVNLPRHCWNLYNLSHPEKSMILLAPLASQAGGYQWCKGKDGQPLAVFPDTQDPDYLAILQAVQAAGARQAQAGRYDLPGWRPNEHYVRWMKRFGILPESFDSAKDPIDPFETDAAYWRSLWYRPPAVAGLADSHAAETR